MKNKELQEILKKFPDNMKVKLYFKNREKLKDFEDENICDHAEDDTTDEQTGEIVKGKQERVIVINPPIF